jgi:hypothetical protein
MDLLTASRELIEKILVEIARVPYAHGDIAIQTVFDRDNDHYLLMLVGRDGVQRVHGCLVHVDLVDGKFWIQRDGTEYGVARFLLDSGIPGDRIVLAFRSQAVRNRSDFAIA